MLHGDARRAWSLRPPRTWAPEVVAIAVECVDLSLCGICGPVGRESHKKRAKQVKVNMLNIQQIEPSIHMACNATLYKTNDSN